MPMVRRAVGDDINVVSGKHLAEVAMDGAIRVAEVGVDFGLGAFGAGPVDIADGKHAGIGAAEHLTEVPASAMVAAADEPESDLLAGGRRVILAERG